MELKLPHVLRPQKTPPHYLLRFASSLRGKTKRGMQGICYWSCVEPAYLLNFAVAQILCSHFAAVNLLSSFRQQGWLAHDQRLCCGVPHVGVCFLLTSPCYFTAMKSTKKTTKTPSILGVTNDGPKLHFMTWRFQDQGADIGEGELVLTYSLPLQKAMFCDLENRGIPTVHPR